MPDDKKNTHTPGVPEPAQEAAALTDGEIYYRALYSRETLERYAQGKYRSFHGTKRCPDQWFEAWNATNHSKDPQRYDLDVPHIGPFAKESLEAFFALMESGRPKEEWTENEWKSTCEFRGLSVWKTKQEAYKYAARAQELMRRYTRVVSLRGKYICDDPAHKGAVFIEVIEPLQNHHYESFRQLHGLDPIDPDTVEQI